MRTGERLVAPGSSGVAGVTSRGGNTGRGGGVAGILVELGDLWVLLGGAGRRLGWVGGGVGDAAVLGAV